MAESVGFCFLLLLLLLIIQPSSALPLCTDLRAPTIVKAPLSFCPYNGSSCCDSTKDNQLQKQFQGMKISEPKCAALVKSILCANCDPFSAELFSVETGQKPVPTLCNTTDSSSSGSFSSKQSTTTTQSFCSTVWTACKDVSIQDSPFAPSLKGAPIASNSSTLAQIWQSGAAFCGVFGGSQLCYTGEPVTLNSTNSTSAPSSGICLEKIGIGSYINMAPHPDGSNRAFFSNLKGQIWMATIPDQDSAASIDVDESNPFVDLTDEVLFDTVFGMMGIAFHPNFAKNGRFFASYNCDRLKSPACYGRCACNSDVNCDPSKVNTSSNNQLCQYQTVIAEFSANGSGSDPSSAMNLKPTEVRRIFTMGLPYKNNHGGQILFGPEDGYLYVMMGDGGGRDDPYNFAQNKKSVLGKVMRIDVDKTSSKDEISTRGLWGNYSIPRDNPYSEDKDSAPEVWALGFRNPWRCSFDAERPSYFMCGDVGQDLYEEIDLVTKDGNYGWGIYEGPLISTMKQKQSLLNKNSSDETRQNFILPISGYKHSDVNKKEGSAAISGGFFYRSNTDPCTYGNYLYADLYASNMFSASEEPKNSGNFTTTNLQFSCAADSPLNCSILPGTNMPGLGYIFSFGEDNNKDVFILASNGVFRVVRPSRCSYACSKEVVKTPAASAPKTSTSGCGNAKPYVGFWIDFNYANVFMLLV
ncbi:hypothetical protein V2J09_019993 [Rumex salicifolius]